MSRKRKIAAGVLISLMTLLVGSVFALSNVALFLGSIPQYDLALPARAIPYLPWSRSMRLP
jgi:predicted membrane protein